MKIQKLGQPLLSKRVINHAPRGPITTNLARAQEGLAKRRMVNVESISPWIAPEHIQTNAFERTLSEVATYTRKALNHVGMKVMS